MKKDKIKRIQRIEESLERIQPAQPTADFLKRLETNLIAHKTEIKRVSISVIFAAAASMALLFAVNLYVLNLTDNNDSQRLSERNMVDEYNLYPTTFKTFGDE